MSINGYNGSTICERSVNKNAKSQVAYTRVTDRVLLRVSYRNEAICCGRGYFKMKDHYNSEEIILILSKLSYL